MSAARRILALAPLAAVTMLATGCSSPEASRTRGGGPGADIGNRRETVIFHDGAQRYHRTPCVTKVECKGPPAVFGKTWKPG
jgi:hypothetical protein